MTPVRIGMVGARFGATVHLQNLAPLRGTRVQVVGICSKSRDSAEACARRHEIPLVTTELAALLDRKDVDAVDLCVPTARGISIFADQPELLVPFAGQWAA